MTDYSNLLERVKKEIRSILLASPRGLPLTRLNSDYRGLVGTNVPYQELGYQKMEDFLRSIPDVVSIQWSSSLNAYLLKGIADDSTKHIEKMVQRQKVSKAGIRLVRRSLPSSRRMPFSTPYDYYSVPPRLRNDSVFPIPTSRTSSAFRRAPDVFTSAPFQSPALITTPPITTPAPITTPKPTTIPKPITTPAPIIAPASIITPVSTVKTKEKSKEVQPSIDKKLKFAELKQEIIELVKNAPDGLVCHTLGSVYKAEFGKDLDFEACGFQTQEDCLEEIPGLVPKKVKGVPRIFLEDLIISPKPPANNQPSTGYLYTWPKVGEEFEDFNSLKNPQPIHVTSDILNSNVDKENDNGEDDGDSIISQSLKQKFREILERYPRGIWAADFPNTFKAYFKEELDYESLGYYSLIELVDDLPSIFTRSRPPECKSDWKLYDARVKESSQKSKPEITKPVSTVEIIIENTISNIRKLLQASSEGIFIDDFIHLYSLNCEMPLNIRELGYDNLEGFFLSIADKVPLMFDYTNARKKIRLAYDASDSSAFNFADFALKVFHPTPPDAVLPGEKYSLQSLPYPLVKGQYFPVYTGTIIHPGLIWIQLKGEDTSDALLDLMDKLEQLYSQSNEYVMLDQHIIIGAICAGIWDYDGSWYRISILSVEMDYVVACFVDYGNNGRIPKSNLRYLKKEFIELPIQAIKARLAFVAPLAGDTWDRKVMDRLVNICKDKVLMADVIQTALHRDTVSIWLCDCTKDEDIHINMWLVEEGLAAYYQEDTGAVASSFPSQQVQNSISSNLAATIPQATDNTFSLNDVPSSEEIVKALMTLLKYNHAQSRATNSNVPIDMSLFANLNINDQLPSNSLQQLLPTLSIGFSNTAAPTQMPSTSSNFYHQPPIKNPVYPSNTSTSVNVNLAVTPGLLHSANPSRITREPNFGTGVEAPLSIDINPSYIRPPTYDAVDDDDDDCGNEMFEDDDEEFDRLCEELGCAPRYVKRVVLQWGYAIHIILYENEPYVTSGDLSNIFWPAEDPDCLQRRLLQNNVPMPVVAVCEDTVPILFHQLRCLKVKGIKQTINKENVVGMVLLYRLKDVIPILNVFGHPSTTIRSEIREELENFDPSSEIWKTFSESCRSEEIEEPSVETDTDKFYRRCVFDLRATLAGIEFKSLRLKRKAESDNSAKLASQIRELNSHYQMYENRIKEILALCSASD